MISLGLRSAKLTVSHPLVPHVPVDHTGSLVGIRPLRCSRCGPQRPDPIPCIRGRVHHL
jgi:hypothetical protein